MANVGQFVGVWGVVYWERRDVERQEQVERHYQRHILDGAAEMAVTARNNKNNKPYKLLKERYKSGEKATVLRMGANRTSNDVKKY